MYKFFKIECWAQEYICLSSQINGEEIIICSICDNFLINFVHDLIYVSIISVIVNKMTRS